MEAAARIIDANVNRAREALRVLDDAARFGLNDAALCERCKALRHELAGVIESLGEAGLDRVRLLAWRDTPGDVGTGVSTEGEWHRRGLAGVVNAAGARLGESLRSIEECVKTLGPGARAAAAAVERIRYRAYEAERAIVLALGSGRGRQWRLCVLVTESMCRAHAWEEVARRAVRGGADCLQLREKTLTDRELLERAKRLVGVAREEAAASAAGGGGAGVSVIVNDRVDVALESGADGVHLGQSDLPVESVRRIAGCAVLVGVSTASMAQAREAVQSGADYCGVGPMFATGTADKPRVAGPGYLAEYVTDPMTGSRPHLAIGGITAANIGALARVGCRGVAVCASVCGAEDPEGACRALLAGLEAGKKEG